MSENQNLTPILTFKTLKNTELGATSVRVNDDDTISLVGVVKLINESMLTSYPRTALHTWTPNRAAVRYSREEMAGRDVKEFPSGNALDVDAVAGLAS